MRQCQVHRVFDLTLLRRARDPPILNDKPQGYQISHGILRQLLHPQRGTLAQDF